MGFQNSFGVDSIGRSGGLALLWHDDWQISLKNFGTGHIDTSITDDKGSTWRFTGFYDHPIRGLQNVSWYLLRRLHYMFSLPWIIGDSPCIQKEGRNKPLHQYMTNFCDVLNQCCLMNLGYDGPNFT